MSDFALIRSEAAHFPVRLLCELLEVSPSGYYAWLNRPLSARKRTELRLVTKMRAVQAETGNVYGSRRMTAELCDDNERVGRRRVQKLMRRHGLQARGPRRFQQTTDSNHDEPIADNLLEQDFHVDEPNVVWASDISYVWTAEGWGIWL